MRVALVPGVLAFLPEYAGIEDPVPDVRAAALAAAAWVAQAGPVEVVGDEQGVRVGRHLLATSSTSGETSADPSPGLVTVASATSSTSDVATSSTSGAYLVVANGSARLTDTSPGYVDARAVPFDDAIEVALRGPDPGALAGLDVELAAELLVGNPAGLVRLGDLLRGLRTAGVDYADAPHGVGYWVGRWEAE